MRRVACLSRGAWRRMMRRLPPRQRFHSSFPQVPLNVDPFAPNRRQVELVRARLRDDDEIHSGRKQVWPEAEAFAANALDSVALDRIANLASNDESEPRKATLCRSRGSSPIANWPENFGSRLRRDEQRKVRSHDAPAELLGSDELGVTAEPLVRPERKGHPPRRGLLLVDGRNEMHPTLAASVREDFSAASRRHAGAKAVRARTPNVVGLISALHDRPFGVAKSSIDAEVGQAVCGARTVRRQLAGSEARRDPRRRDATKCYRTPETPRTI
jgi:hypothetical protein